MTTASTGKREASKPFIFLIHTFGNEDIPVKLLRASHNSAIANYGNPPSVRVDYGYEGYSYGQFLGARKYFKVGRIEISTNVELDITNPLSWKTIDDTGNHTGGGVFLRKLMPGKYIAEPSAPFIVTPDTEISYTSPGSAQIIMNIFPTQVAQVVLDSDDEITMAQTKKQRKWLDTISLVWKAFDREAPIQK
jgi:hypothetical protein